LHQSIALLNLKELYGWSRKEESDLANPVQTLFDEALSTGTALVED